MITTKIGSSPYIEAYQLLAKLNNLTLTGMGDGELEFTGTFKHWHDAGEEEHNHKCDGCV